MLVLPSCQYPELWGLPQIITHGPKQGHIAAPWPLPVLKALLAPTALSELKT